MQDHAEYRSALGRAIEIWKAGRRISMTLAAKLMEEGYDVGSLEQHHMKVA